MPSLITATGVLGFLADEEPELKVFALSTLNDDIDTVWTEVAGAVSQMYVNQRRFEPSFFFAQLLTTTVRPSMRTRTSPSASSPRSSSPRSTTTSRPTARA